MADNAQRTAYLPAAGTSFSPHIFSVFLNRVCYKILFLHIEGEPTCLYELYFSSISTLVDFLILKCQGTNKTPFDTHPKTILSALISLLFLVYFSKLKSELRSRYNVLNRCMFVCWLFTCVSLVSLVVRDSIRPILYVLGFLVSSFELICPLYWRILRDISEWLNHQRVRIVGFVINMKDYIHYRDQRQMVVMLPV